MSSAVDLKLELERLGKSSLRSALLSAIGLAVLLASLIISAVRLQRSQATLAARTVELDAKLSQVKDADRELAIRDGQKRALEQEIQTAQQQLQVKKDALSEIAELAARNDPKALDAIRSKAVVQLGGASELWQQGFKAFNAGRRDEAEQKYQASIAADPNYAASYNSLGRLKDDAGDLSGAEALYQKAVTLMPNYAPALYNLALVQTRRGNVAAAKTWNDKALAARPNYAPALQLAKSLSVPPAAPQGAPSKSTPGD